MFETNEKTEILIHRDAKRAYEHVWSCVHRRKHDHWFYVIYDVDNPDYVGGRFIIFLMDSSQLVDLDQAPGIDIVEAYMVIPGFMNAENRWKMEPLYEIWKAYEPECLHLQTAEIYVMMNGSRYVDSGLKTEETELLDPELIYRFKNIEL